jgi:integrase
VPLDHSAARYLWYGLATKTRSSYETAKNSYTAFCASRRINQAFPANVSSLTSWVANLADRGLAVTTVKAYLAGLRSAHVDFGFIAFDDSFYHPMLQRVVDGVRKFRGDADSKERLPITRDLLVRILRRFDTNTQFGAIMHAAFSLAFAGFLRVGEFTYTAVEAADPEFSQWHLTRNSTALHKDHMELLLPSSKTDPFRRGVSLTIAAAHDEACPVRSIRRLFERFPTDTPHAPLFFTSATQFFTRQLVVDTLRKALEGLGIAGHYSGHSFRRGAATSAREAGLSEEDIMLLGRWKSDSWRLYVTTHPEYVAALSRRLQRGSPSARLSDSPPGSP